MNYANTVNSKYMKPVTKIFAYALLLLPAVLQAQQSPVLSLDSILQRIDQKNILLQSYELKAQSFNYSAEASTAWMAPMVGLGTFMTPYPGQKLMDDRDKGNLMVQIEQDIPNPVKQRAKKQYIASQGAVERASRAVALNEMKAQAKRLYFNWLIAHERIKVLEENESVMLTMKKIEEVRYPYNQSLAGNIYKAESKIEENRNMVKMQNGTIAKARSWLNSLMNADGNGQFEIDTTYQPVFTPATSYDTASLALQRKDILKMNESIRSMQLNVESMKLNRKPDFRIRFDHMSPLAKMMPQAYSIMGMVSIPIAPWSAKMYKNEVKAMQLSIQGMEKERSAMLQETQGMLFGMQYELRTMQQRIEGMEKKIIPALQRTMDLNFLSYQENKMNLSNVIDAWEAITMMQMNVLDEKLKLYEMIVDYEKQLYR